MKYQFCIRFHNIDANSAASKAVLDCNKIFSAHGYQDYTFTVGDNSNKKVYYRLLFKELIRFFFAVKRKSLVGIQYPLLSINSVFKYFIRIARLKGIKFFCIVHDLESLRVGGKDNAQIQAEVANLNYYDTIIVHNHRMMDWLTQAGVTQKMISLELFDYLSDDFTPSPQPDASGPVVYAGNLRKSAFIYDLPQITARQFTVYGPNFREEDPVAYANIHWAGVFPPDEVPQKLQGSFGLIWDGTRIDRCDEILGNYLKYNNPHKCSLYIAAGLPVIAPKNSAIGEFVKNMNIGVQVDNLHDLQNLSISQADYAAMKNNVLAIREKVIKGQYFSSALTETEKEHASTT